MPRVCACVSARARPTDPLFGPQTASHSHSSKAGSTCVGGELKIAGARNDGSHALATEVVEVSTGTKLKGQQGSFNTYRVYVHLGPNALNVFSIFGSSQPMIFPPAYQFTPPFGSNVGAVNPVMWSIKGEGELDSPRLIRCWPKIR
mgnify:CR=1 FL=1